MSGDQKFFLCKHCGNLVGMVNNAGVKIICCGEPMIELIPNTVEASAEKHLPVISKEGNLVTVEIGSVPHPTLPEHHIEWVYIETKKGGQRKCLLVGDTLKVSFGLVDDEIVSAFAYCNIHGLWRTMA